MRLRPFLPLLLLAPAISAPAQVSISIGLPHMNIGINVPTQPELVQVPGSPVYYAPSMPSNYFFYDGMYWVYKDDNWFAASWYNGPWAPVHPEAVPDFMLRIPVSYYHQPPAFFRGWDPNAPPRWGDHWGGDWARRRTGWDHWDHRAIPAPAALPTYQKGFRGNNYPTVDRQHDLHQQNYHYQPQEPVVKDHYAVQAAHAQPAPARQEKHEEEHRH